MFGTLFGESTLTKIADIAVGVAVGAVVADVAVSAAEEVIELITGEDD